MIIQHKPKAATLTTRVSGAKESAVGKRFKTTMAEASSQTSKSATALFASLQNHTSAQVGQPGARVIEIDSHESPIDAANTLWEHKILGVPVWNDTTKRYCGVFDMRDILSAVVSTAKARHHQQSIDYSYTAVMAESLSDVKHMEEEGVQVTLTYLASRNPVHCCPPDTTLQKLCQVLAEPRCRRVLVCEKEGTHCTNLISRSSLVKFMSENATDMNEPIFNSGLDYRKEVVLVKENTSAFEAFELIDDKGLYGIAVVGKDTGKLVGCTSARDIKYAALDEAKTAMDMDIMEYLSVVRQKTYGTQGRDRHPFCHVREDDTIMHVVNTLAKTSYHRVFVVDGETRPIGVISVADILRFACEKSGSSSEGRNR